VASRTQIVCLCEGTKGASIDAVFINKLIKCLDPNWLRPWGGSNTIRLVPCGGRKALIEKMPAELQGCLTAGADTTLMLWADLDHDRDNGDALKADFWKEAQRNGIGKDDFDRVVFIFAKDRLENWIEFLETGNTDEYKEDPRVKHNRRAADAARKLAEFCKAGKLVDGMPPSLQWSCRNWRALVERMRRS
jgi:hypothetical protein